MRYPAMALAALLFLPGVADAQLVERGTQVAQVVRESMPTGEQKPKELLPKVERYSQDPKRASGQEAEAIGPDRYLELGWDFFKNGNWLKAEESFGAALDKATGETISRARLGLGYASIRLGKLAQARENFEKTVQAGYEPQETIPALLTVLKAQGDRKAMEDYLALLPPSQRTRWEDVRPVPPAPAQAHAPTGIRVDFAKAGTKASPAALEALVKANSGALSSCADTDVFFSIAKSLAAQGAADPAKSLNSRLLRCPTLDFGIRMGAMYELASLTSPDIVREHMRRFEEKAGKLSPKQRGELSQLALVLDLKELGNRDLSPPRRLDLARSILKTDPREPNALSVLAWDDLNAGRHDKALKEFTALAATHPDRSDARLGLGYALYHAGRLDEALAIAGPAAADDPAMKDLAYQVHVKKAFDAVEARNYRLASQESAKAAATWPEGTEVKEIDGWVALGTGDAAKAYSLFDERYKATSDKRFLAPMLLALSKTGQRGKAFETAATLASDSDPKLKQQAGAFYLQEKAPILASKADPEGPAANASTQMADVKSFVRGKTGDPGTSRLTEWTSAVSYSWAHPDGWRAGFSYSPTYLYSGDAAGNPYAGSYYARAQGLPQRNSLVTDITVHTPNIFLDVEGPYRWRLEGGTTPIGGPVGIMPTFLVSASTPAWEVAAYQKAVTESILSWIGQRDPYSSKTWGRVLRTGGRASYVFVPWERWFLSLGGGAEYIWGQNVADNVGLRGNVSAGRTFDVGGNEAALGVYATIKHYSRNLNFYTFGHGGYYSPDMLFIAGPFLRLRSPEQKDYWFDLEGSVGFMYERTASAPKYPLGGSGFNLTSGALTELGGSYAGKTETKFAYSAKGEALKLITPYFAAGVFGGVNNAADYREAYGGLGLRVYFDPQKGFWAPKDLFRSYTPLERE